MRIDESKIFEFKFPFYGGELGIPVRAQSREEAAEMLKSHFNGFMLELAIAFPKIAPSDSAHSRIDTEPPTGGAATETPPVSAVPSYALELDIEQLVKDLMPIKKPAGAQTVDQLVKKWTGFTYAPENYLAIIEDLKRLKKTL